MTGAFEIAALIASPTIVAAYSLAQKRWELQRADLTEARKIIDTAAMQVSRERDAVHQLLYVWRTAPGVDTFNRAIDHANATRVESRAVLSQVIFRLGREADITRRYQDVLDEIELFVTTVQAAVSTGHGQDAVAERKFLDFMKGHVERFENACFALAGVSLARRHMASEPTMTTRLNESD
jgi:hypothetical protein